MSSSIQSATSKQQHKKVIKQVTSCVGHDIKVGTNYIMFLVSFGQNGARRRYSKSHETANYSCNRVMTSWDPGRSAISVQRARAMARCAGKLSFGERLRTLRQIV